MVVFICIFNHHDESRREGFCPKPGVREGGHLSSLFISEAA